jgi:glycosyltransferase involved in cell wall biosynthesis
MSAPASVPLVTVVVPVWGEAPGLGACLDALGRQSWPPDRLEVLVVDNGAPPGAAASAAAGRPGVRLLGEEGEGSYAARNRGIAEARGEVIAFTDSDCTAAPDWVERGVARLKATPSLGLVGGRIRLTFGDPGRPTSVELYESVASFRQESYVLRGRFAATANAFTTRAVLDRVGVFDARMKSLGDVDWGVRVQEAGFGLAYAEEVRVDHPARRTLAEFRARSARMAGGFRDLGRTGRWPLGRRMRYAATGLPPLGTVLLGPGLGGPVRRLRVLGVGAVVVLVRVLTLARLLAGGRTGR